MSAKFLPISDFCVRTHGASCRRCSIACPAHAIEFAGETSAPTIDHEVCTGCGICMGICDGFSSTRVTIQDLHSRIRRIGLRGEAVYLTCKENILPDFTPAENVIVLPCLALVPTELWTLILAQNIPVCIVCDLRYCEECTIAPNRGEMLFSRAIETAEDFTGGKVRWDHQVPEKRDVSHVLTDETGYGRREAFDSIKDDVTDVLSGKRRLKNSEVLQDYYERRERNRAIQRLNISGSSINKFAPHGVTRKVLFPHHEMLLDAAIENPSVSTAILMTISETDMTKCAGHTDCVATCITGARSLSKLDGSLEYDARLCIGCGACVDTCPEGAIRLIDTTAYDVLEMTPPNA